jgi:hypothetical protein
MSQGFLVPIMAATCGLSSRAYGNAGLLSDGGFWTADISESPKDAAECSLSAVLQTHVSPRYFLSPKAAAGILRRAEKRGRELPEPLRSALTLLASEDDNREVRQAMFPMPSPDLQATPDMIPTGRTSSSNRENIWSRTPFKRNQYSPVIQLDD